MNLESTGLWWTFGSEKYRVRHKKVAPPPRIFFAIFLAIAWNFFAKFYTLMQSSYTYIPVLHLIIEYCLKIISIAALPPGGFSAFKNFCTKTHAQNPNTNLLRTKFPNYLTKDQWTPNSPDLNPLVISWLRAMLEAITSVIQSRRRSTNSRKRCR